MKTGAADSAWVRSVIAYNDGVPDGLIVITGDSKALERTCEEIGIDEPRSGKHLGDVSDLLEESSAASRERAAEFSAWLQGYFVDGLADPHGEGARLTEIIDLGRYSWWEVEAIPDDGYEPWELQDQIVAPVNEAEVLGEIEHDRWTDTLTAKVRLTADVEEQYARQDPSGEHAQYRARTYPGSVQAKVRLFIENGQLAYDGALEDVELLPPTSTDIAWTSI